jgi:hypothetical protein
LIIGQQNFFSTSLENPQSSIIQRKVPMQSRFLFNGPHQNLNGRQIGRIEFALADFIQGFFDTPTTATEKGSDPSMLKAHSSGIYQDSISRTCRIIGTSCFGFGGTFLLGHDDLQPTTTRNIDKHSSTQQAFEEKIEWWQGCGGAAKLPVSMTEKLAVSLAECVRDVMGLSSLRHSIVTIAKGNFPCWGRNRCRVPP